MASLAPGSSVGSYEIVSLMGKGGMGEVYRARDLKLKREVAIKALPQEFSTDADRLLRFQREAETLAVLNHSNIGSIYDLQESSGTRYLILELVEGDTLADIIAQRGAIPMEEALSIARQICVALEAAHEKGIVHRDLKPANIKITPDDKVKVLDFGLAKVLESARAGSMMSQSPTLLTAATGTILGTASYMSPEQAKGRSANHSSDVWAFGCVLYEMLTGRELFGGETVSEVLAAVLKTDPDFSTLPAETPDWLRQLLQRCLQKDPRRRWQSIGDVRLELEEPHAVIAKSVSRGEASFRWREAVAWTIVVLALAAAGLIWRTSSPAVGKVSGATLLFTVSPPDDGSFRDLLLDFSVALSPDGKHLAFSANAVRAQVRAIWVRSMDSLEPRKLAGSEVSSYPFWSPDSRSVAFFAGSTLKRIDLDSKSAQTICEVKGNRGGAWGRETIIAGSEKGLIRVSPAQGTVQPLNLTLPAGLNGVPAWPSFLPDQKHFLFSAGEQILLGSLDSVETTALLKADFQAVYAGGYLLFQKDGTVYAQPFDTVRNELRGERTRLLQGLSNKPQHFAVSGTGLLAWRSIESLARTELHWYDRAGRVTGTLGTPGTYINPTLSPDQAQVAVGKFDADRGTYDVSLIDAARNVPTRFTSDPGTEFYPVFSPDGKRLAFTMFQETPKQGTYLRQANGSGKEELLFAGNPSDWTRDGKYILFGGNGDLQAYSFVDRKVISLLPTPFTENNAHASFDGRWIAYQADESGQGEIYVRPFPNLEDGRWQVTTTGGQDPRWRGDGKELFYFSRGDKTSAVMSVVVTLQPDHPTFGAPQKLFSVFRGAGNRSYEVTSDGQRFLINTALEDSRTSVISVLANWQANLKSDLN